jgi:triphosphatase
MTEPMEAELKLTCSAADLRTLQEHPRLREARSHTEGQLRSVYFDTDDQDLRQAGFVLRVRAQDGRHVQTAKSAGDGLFERSEWEQAVSGPRPDRAALAKTPLAEALGPKAHLEPQFTVAVERRSYEVEEGSSLIEVALDKGRIETLDGDAVHVSELELELKEGTPSDLFALARSLVADVPVRLCVRGKAERGYLLLDGTPDEVQKAEPLPLDVDMTAADAFKAIAHACLRHMRLNEDILLDHRDPDALHQVRVAIRRLRSAFSLYGDLILDYRSERLRADLKRLSEPLGRARNLDVFLTKTLPKERARHPDVTGLLGLERYLEAQRTEAYAEVMATLNSDAWRHHVVDLVAWINAGPWLFDDRRKAARDRDQSAQAFAAGVLEKRRRQVKKRGRDLDTLSPEDRHQVRIAAKKLRYGAEFFGGLYTGKKASKRHAAFVKALSELQDCLGDLNDIATGHELLDDLTDTNLKATSAVFAAGVTAADIEARSGKLLKAAAKAHEELVEMRPFWR